MTHGYHKERGAYVLARAGRRHGARRRGERLMATARKKERGTVGAGDAAATEVITPNIWVRMTQTEDAGFTTILWAATRLIVLALVIGPAFLIGKALYGLRYALLSRLGPMRIWPWLVATGVALAASIATWYVWPANDPIGRLWIYLQVVGGFARTAYLVYAYGWLAVQRTPRSGGVEVEVGVEAPVEAPTVEVDLNEQTTEPETTEEETETQHKAEVEIGEDPDAYLEEIGQ